MFNRNSADEPEIQACATTFPHGSCEARDDVRAFLRSHSSPGDLPRDARQYAKAIIQSVGLVAPNELFGQFEHEGFSTFGARARGVCGHAGDRDRGGGRDLQVRGGARVQARRLSLDVESEPWRSGRRPRLWSRAPARRASDGGARRAPEGRQGPTPGVSAWRGERPPGPPPPPPPGGPRPRARGPPGGAPPGPGGGG